MYLLTASACFIHYLKMPFVNDIISEWFTNSPAPCGAHKGVLVIVGIGTLGGLVNFVFLKVGLPDNR